MSNEPSPQPVRPLPIPSRSIAGPGASQARPSPTPVPARHSTTNMPSHHFQAPPGSSRNDKLFPFPTTGYDLTSEGPCHPGKQRSDGRDPWYPIIHTVAATSTVRRPGVGAAVGRRVRRRGRVAGARRRHRRATPPPPVCLPSSPQPMLQPMRPSSPFCKGGEASMFVQLIRIRV